MFFSQEAARQFLDEEAELSQQDADSVSSDENDDTGSELNSSLAQFLNDDAEVTQVLNGEWGQLPVVARQGVLLSRQCDRYDRSSGRRVSTGQ